MFTVNEINRLHKIPMYYLEDNSGEAIKGAFYAQQLQKVVEKDREKSSKEKDTRKNNDSSSGDKEQQQQQLHQIEKIIGRTRKIKGIPHRYVKWKGFSAAHNQWVPVSEIRQQQQQ